MATVVLKNARKIYNGNTVAVDDFSLRVEDGEFVVLVGPSGCGKSTTLRLIAGLEEADGGEIFIDGRLANDLPPKDRNIAMVFQNYALYPHMDAYRNMAFGLKLRKYPREEIDDRVREAADILGIRDLLHRKPKELSGGQRQRVALGRAIVRKPKVFLFDEPLSNLDARLRVQMRTELSKLHARLNATMIYVTHDQVEAMTMGDRLVVMQDGRIQQVGAPVHLYRRPANRFVAGFIGSPAMNFLEGELVRDAGLAFRRDGLRLPIPDRHRDSLTGHIGRRVILGIRPEHIHYASSARGPGESENVSANVDLVEPMGHETLLYLTVGRASCVARVTADPVPSVDEEVRLAFDLSYVHFFDRETEAALLRDTPE